jgi:hypothetical protein
MRMLITDHCECYCQGEFTGTRCEFPFLLCPDGTRLESVETIVDSAVYRCICPYGFRWGVM